MFNLILKKIFGSQNERYIKKLKPTVALINEKADNVAKLSDDDLRAKTDEFKKKIAQGASLDDILVEAFSVVREAAKRTIGICHYDVQLIGGMVLHRGAIAEMVTGEGKTLVATLAVYLNALTEKGVHVVTVNDYLAMRDRNWMGPVYEFLGLSVGVIQNGMGPRDRQEAYGADITYGTNNEFGFDYLRDNMVVSEEDMVQRPLHYAVVDELDSILIDEARTPLIISGPVDEVNTAYQSMNPLVKSVYQKQKRYIDEHLDLLEAALKENNEDQINELLYIVHKGSPKNQRFLTMILNDASLKSRLDKAVTLFDSKTMQKEREELQGRLYFTFEEKSKDVVFMKKGEDEFVKSGIDFILGDIDEIVKEVARDESLTQDEKQQKELELWQEYTEQKKKLESIKQLLKAYVLFYKDVDYVIHENKIVIIDEFTGRMMPGRRFSDGLHESIEAKEGVEVQRESQTLASITFQNYFKMYDKLSGMTGTAQTEAEEFKKIYNLDVVTIPTNRPLARINHPDVIYKTEKEKFSAVCSEIAEKHEKGQPVLVGTVSIAKNEKLSQLLTKHRIAHNVLNAKQHDKEADIIKLAGQKYSVTIATNMAGRGTDIVLGDGVAALGGLHVIGTERHESRRIDNQLRGRSGRQGDAGSSRFYLSLEDDLMRIFGSDRIKGIMERLGMEENQDLQHPLISRSIQTAQKRVETQNFEIRKHLIEYDNVMNKQRTVIYEERRNILSSENLYEHIFEIAEEVIEFAISSSQPFNDEDAMDGFYKYIKAKFMVSIDPEKDDIINRDDLYAIIMGKMKEIYALKQRLMSKEQLKEFERLIILGIIDTKWKHHLYSMDEMREGIGLRAYGQRDPLVEYQHEAFRMFEDMITSIKEDILEKSLKAVLVDERIREGVFHTEDEKFLHPEVAAIGAGNQTQSFGAKPPPPPQKGSPQGTFKRSNIKVGRNEFCPCGSGKKYKKCCGK